MGTTSRSQASCQSTAGHRFGFRALPNRTNKYECLTPSVRSWVAALGIRNPHHPPVPAEPRDAPLSGPGHRGAGAEPNPARTQGSPRADREQRARSAAGRGYGGVFLSAQAFIQTLKWKITLSCWKYAAPQLITLL